MRTPADFPRIRRPGRARFWLIAAAVVLVFGVTSLRGIAGFYTTYLWFTELGFGSVWRGVLGTKVALVAAFSLGFFVLLLLNLVIADRLAPRFRPIGRAEDELVQRYREAVGGHAGKVRLVVAALFALLAGGNTAGQWNNWLLFRNSVSFDTPDPQFGKDISFFVFRLPFMSFVVDWLFVAVFIVTVVTIVAHYLNGGIRLQGNAQRVSAHVKAHVSVLLGVLALLKAAGYYLQKYELSFSTRGAVQGATYTDVKAQLPALQLLFWISLAAAVLFLLNIRRQGWVLPIIAVGLWAFIAVIVGALVPAFVQKFRVEPAEAQREKPYIERNIEATRAAMGLDKITAAPFPYDEDVDAQVLSENASTIRNVRLWDPNFVGRTYEKLQEIRQYYKFNEVDIDRYTIDGELTQTIVSARELNSADLPSQSWQNRHLNYTHGYGALVSPANAVKDGNPEFLVKDVPPVGTPEITEPRLYFGEGQGGYAIVNTEQQEVDFQRLDGKIQESRYAGKGGVPLSSFVRRLAFALRFGDQNVLISGLIKPESRAVFIRDIRDRVQEAAPFLRYDADPYPVIVKGRILWVQDAYTITSRYPNAQRANIEQLPQGSGLNTAFNYVRNSVKVVTDAYDGTMTFYVVDPEDRVIQAYQRAFPNLFTDRSKMDPELVEHLRYPEDIFRVQTNMYGRYHITNPVEFYRGTDAWNVSQDPGSGDPSAGPQEVRVLDAAGRTISTKNKRMDPTYLLLRLPGDDKESFLILRPFVAASKDDKQQNMTGFMTAKSEPGGFGTTLQVFEMPPGDQIDGPVLVDARVKANTEITSLITFLNQQGSKVLQGNMLVLPIQNSLLYVRPLYVQAANNPVPEVRKVIIVFGDRAEMGDTLQEALTKRFGAAPPTRETGPTTPGGVSPPPTPGPGLSSTVRSLLQQAQGAYDAAQAALTKGDLAEYQKQVNEMGRFVRQASEQAAADSASAGSGSSPTTTTTAAGTSA